MPLANEQIGQTFLGGAEFFFSGRTIGEVAVSSEIEMAEAVDSHGYRKASEVPASETSTGKISATRTRLSSNALVETTAAPKIYGRNVVSEANVIESSSVIKKYARNLVSHVELRNTREQHKKNSILGLGALGAGYLGYWMAGFLPKQTVPAADGAIRGKVSDVSLVESQTSQRIAAFVNNGTTTETFTTDGVDYRAIPRTGSTSETFAAKATGGKIRNALSSSALFQSSSAVKKQNLPRLSAVAEVLVSAATGQNVRRPISAVVESSQQTNTKSHGFGRFSSAFQTFVAAATTGRTRTEFGETAFVQAEAGVRSTIHRETGAAELVEAKTEAKKTSYLTNSAASLVQAVSSSRSLQAIVDGAGILVQVASCFSFARIITNPLPETYIEKTAAGVYGEMSQATVVDSAQPTYIDPSTGILFEDGGVGSYKDGP